MILTDNKSIEKLIGLDIIAEIADDYTFSTDAVNKEFPVVDQLQDAWVERVEDSLSSYQIHDFLGRIDWQSIADNAIMRAEERRDAEAESEDLSGWEYDKETGEYNERRYW